MSHKVIVQNFASESVPIFIEKKSEKIVFFGEDNLYPYELIDLYNDSSTHNAVINGKVGYIVGNGLFSEDVNTQKWLGSASLMASWDDILKNISTDYELFNGFAIEVKRTSAGNVYSHLDFSNCRVGLNGMIAYSDDWITELGVKNYKPKIQWFEKYRPDDLEQISSIIYYAEYRPNFKHYPLPVYVGSLSEIQTDVAIGDYWLNEIENGFSGGTLIKHNNGAPETTEELKEFEKSFAAKFGGPNGTKIVHLFAASKENESSVENLNGNDLHERYAAMSQRVKESIFIGHRVTNPILFGVKEAGQLGGRNELDLAYEIFQNTYVTERQNTILKILRRLAIIDGVSSEIEIVQLKPIDNLDLTSEIIIANLTNSEIRDLISERTGLELAEPTNEIASIDLGDKQIKNGDANEEVLQKETSYNGAQISSALEIVQNVKNGFLTKQQGLAFLTEFLRIDVLVATQLLNNGTFSKFSDDDISHLFEKIGNASSDFEIIESREIEFDTDGTPIEFATDLEKDQEDVLAAIVKNPLITTLGISQLLGLSVENVLVTLEILKLEKLVNVEGSTIKPTEKGKKTANEVKIPEAKLMYRYELRSDAPPLLTESRPFCKKMMAMDKLYTRKQIEFLRNDMDKDFSNSTNVWLARGGWYRAPNTEVAVPFCRHIWKQVLVRKK